MIVAWTANNRTRKITIVPTAQCITIITGEKPAKSTQSASTNIETVYYIIIVLLSHSEQNCFRINAGTREIKRNIRIV